MADPNDPLDPEPVDAEFEPADDAAPPAARPKSGPGFLALFTVFVFAMFGGGALGYYGAIYFPPADDGSTAAEHASLSETVTALQTRLAELENQPAPADPADTFAPRLDSIAARLTELETRPAPAAEGTQPAIDTDALEARIAALEAAADNRPAVEGNIDMAAIESRLAELEASTATLDALANQALDAAQSQAAPAIDPAVLQDLTDRLDDLETAMAQQQTDQGNTASTAQIAALTARIETLESALTDTAALARNAQSTADEASAQSRNADTGEASRLLAARALALTALREIAITGDGFEAERAALARLWQDNEDLDAMRAYARAGVPARDELAASYPGDAIRAAAGPGRVFFGLIEVRQSDAADDATGPLAITGLAEARLADEDLAGAITLTEQLEGEALDTARDWLLAAQTRLDLDARLLSLRQALADEAARQGEDPA